MQQQDRINYRYEIRSNRPSMNGELYVDRIEAMRQAVILEDHYEGTGIHFFVYELNPEEGVE